MRYVFILLMLASFSNSYAEKSLSNSVGWIITSTNDEEAHIVELKDQLEYEGDCVVNQSKFPRVRIRLSKEDANVYDMLVAAKIEGKEIGFYYNTFTELQNIKGHKSGECEFVSVWLK